MNRKPGNINLSSIGQRSYFRFLTRGNCTIKHKLHLMLLAFRRPKLMLPGTIFADEPQFPHYNVDANFLLAFSAQRFIQCFPVSLSASWKTVPFSFTVKVLKGVSNWSLSMIMALAELRTAFFMTLVNHSWFGQPSNY